MASAAVVCPYNPNDVVDLKAWDSVADGSSSAAPLVEWDGDDIRWLNLGESGSDNFCCTLPALTDLPPKYTKARIVGMPAGSYLYAATAGLDEHCKPCWLTDAKSALAYVMRTAVGVQGARAADQARAPQSGQPPVRDPGRRTCHQVHIGTDSPNARACSACGSGYCK